MRRSIDEPATSGKMRKIAEGPELVVDDGVGEARLETVETAAEDEVMVQVRVVDKKIFCRFCDKVCRFSIWGGFFSNFRAE